MALEISTTRDAGGAITTRTPGVPDTGQNDLFAALIKQKLAQQTRPAPAAAAPRQPAPSVMTQRAAPAYDYEPEYERAPPPPRMGAAPIAPSLGVQRSLPRYSYASNPNAWAGTAPILPTMSGYGREGEDFILEGGDVRSLVNSGRGGGGPSSPPVSSDPRLAMLTAQQQRTHPNLTPDLSDSRGQGYGHTYGQPKGGRG